MPCRREARSRCASPTLGNCQALGRATRNPPWTPRSALEPCTTRRPLSRRENRLRQQPPPPTPHRWESDPRRPWLREVQSCILPAVWTEVSGHPQPPPRAMSLAPCFQAADGTLVLQVTLLGPLGAPYREGSWQPGALLQPAEPPERSQRRRKRSEHSGAQGDPAWPASFSHRHAAARNIN